MHRVQSVSLGLILIAAACGGAPGSAPCPAAPAAAAPVAEAPAATAGAPAAPTDGAASPPVADPAGALTVAVLPRPAYIERSDEAQLVNCDLLIDNGTGVDWEITAIQVSVRDRRGALSWRKVINANGVRPGIRIVPERVVPARGQILVLNPLYAFPRDLELATLRFDVTLGRDGSDEERTASVDVAPAAYRNRARLRLPVGGRVLVWDGHDFESHHRRWDYVFAPIRAFGFDSNPGRYSYDLVPVDAAGAMSSGDPARNESWFGFGQPVRSPAAGTVVAVVGDRADDRTFDQDQLKNDLHVVFGNYIVVDHGHGEFSMLGHLRQGSPRVKVGDRVTAGQPIAAIGASGSSLMPHLHYQLQTAADGHAEGLPSYFHDYRRVVGSRVVPVGEGQIDSGDIVESKR
jgi:biotin carboxyl carrier protein